MDPLDSVTFLKLEGNREVRLGEREDLIATFTRTWPAIRWDNPDTDLVCGNLMLGKSHATVTLSFDPRAYGASIELSDGQFFDAAFLAEVEALCETKGWRAMYFDSAEDTYL